MKSNKKIVKLKTQFEKCYYCQGPITADAKTTLAYSIGPSSIVFLKKAQECCTIFFIYPLKQRNK